jgi:hypothetical protein
MLHEPAVTTLDAAVLAAGDERFAVEASQVFL